MATTVTLKPNAIDISGSTSGTTTLQATAVAGTTTLTLPAATDTLVGKATTDTLTNKTLTGAVMNGTVGATTPSTGAFTTLSATGVTTVQAGTAALPAITTSGDTNTGIFFPAADTIAFTEGGVECARFNSSGNFQTIATIGVGNATPSTSGAGITFPATQSASTDANTLDDYEEGTWTPSVTNMTTTGSPSYAGVYTKIGNLVLVNFYSTNTVGTTYSPTLNSTSVAGLPFTTKNTTTSFQSFTGTCGNGNTTAGGTVGASGNSTTVFFMSTLTATQAVSFTVLYVV
jgi:hypothetical protein